LKAETAESKIYAFYITILTLFIVNVLPIRGVRSRSGSDYRQSKYNFSVSVKATFTSER